MVQLVLLESPNKVAKIQKYLDAIHGAGVMKVAATAGHFRDLPLPRGRSFDDIVNTETWEETYDITSRRTASALKRLIAAADVVYLATDLDREGEYIAWHVADEYGLKEPLRVVYSEITKSAIKAAFENPRPLDLNLVDAARSRRVLDYTIGMQVSPLLWRFDVKSAGRVQSAALRIVIDRETAIAEFPVRPFWKISARYEEGFSANVAVYDEPSDEEMDEDPGLRKEKRLTARKFWSEGEARAAVAEAKRVPHVVAQVESVPKSTPPPKPYETATLFADAARKLGWGSDKTSKIAQTLFEGGHITYIRTDSVALSTEAEDMIRSFIKKNHPDALPDAPQRHSSSKGAQEAHEAIRPTTPEQNPRKLGLEGDLAALYELIFFRTVLCQCADLITERTTVSIEPKGCAYRLLATGSVVVEPGWQRLAPPKKAPGQLPLLKVGQVLNLAEIKATASKTSPPPRFTEASLTKYLKRKGIGRPSTYANTFKTLRVRNFVKEQKKRLVPAETGLLADRLTRGSFGNLTEETYTAKTEDRLDKIAKGKRERVAFLAHFYKGFTEMRLNAEGFLAGFAMNHPELDRNVAKAHDKPCSKCGSAMVVKTSRHGPFAVCDSRDCGNKTDLTPQKTLRAPCPKCKGGVVEQPYIKDGKNRSFFRCVDDACAWKSSAKPTAHKCPTCTAPVLEQSCVKEKKRKTFYLCSDDVCGWKDSLRPPTRTDWPCHADPNHGAMFQYKGTSSKTKKPYTMFRCHACRDAAPNDSGAGVFWSGPKPPACPACHAPMRERSNNQGSFWGCSKFPECRSTLQFE